MRLDRVIYELFDSDAQSLDVHQADDWHEIDRQIRLEVSSASPIYITWHNQPVTYAIQVFDHPVFDQPAPVLRDMSHSPLWRDLIGKAIRLQFLDESHQVLEIRAGAHVVYCSSQEKGNWLADVVHVSAARPEVPDRLDLESL